MYILGINQGHDASAALIDNDSIIAAAQEERFNRIKHFYGFPLEAIKFVLKKAGIGPADIKYIALPHGPDTLIVKSKNIYTRIPSLAAARLSRSDIIRGLKKLGINRCKKIFYIDHHLAHAASAYRCSGWDEATVITLDGNGDNLSGSIYHGRDGNLFKISEITTQGSLGWFYSAVTEGIGFRPNDEEGKTMSIAAYGKIKNGLMKKLREYAPRLRGLILQRDKPWRVSAEGVSGIYKCHFDDSREIKKLAERYGREDVAACAQAIVEDIVKKLVRNAVKITGCGNLAAAGGIFFNVKLNMLLERLSCVSEIRPHPATGDSGLALGAALEAAGSLRRHKKLFKFDNVYLGPSFNNRQILAAVNGAGLKHSIVKYNEIPLIVSGYLRKGLAVGWFQRGMEYGARALGSRSVLVDPRNIKAMKRLNIRLKKREWFMPFAPSILIDKIEDYAHKGKSASSPFMMKAFKARTAKMKHIKACVHVDGTIRPQTVSRKQDPLYYNAIERFYKDTGVAAVLNTSFNRHGLPIVCTPKDAIDHLKMGCVDLLVINNIIVANDR